MQIDPLRGQGFKHRFGDTGLGAHGGTNNRYLGHIGRGINHVKRKLIFDFIDNFYSLVHIGTTDRKADIGLFGLGGRALHNHINIDMMIGQSPENDGRHARLVGKATMVNFASSGL